MPVILTDDDYFDLIDDTDADSPPCTLDCLCPLCVASDRDEQRLLAQADRAGPDEVDLDALTLACGMRPWKEGEAA